VLNTFFIVGLTFSLAPRILAKAKPKAYAIRLGALSCFIYMAHCLALPRTLKVLALVLLPGTDLQWAGVYLAAATLTLALLASCFAALRTFAPRLLGTLIGRI